jgi:hypothetical protein
MRVRGERPHVALAARAALVVLSALVVALDAGPAAAGGGAQDTDTGLAAQVELVGQDAWTPIGGDLHLRVRVPEALATPDATLSLVAYQPIPTRSAFERVLQSQSTGSVLDQVVVPMEDLPAGPGGARPVTVGIESSGAARDPARLSLRRTGVYPLAVEVRDENERSRGRFLTMVVAVAVDLTGAASGVAERLGVAWTWPLTAGPSTLPDGSPDPRVTNALRPRGRLGRQAAALTRAGDLPLTLVPGPDTLEAWTHQGEDDPAIARGAAAVRDAAGRNQIVTGTYVPTDLPSLLAARLDSTVDAELVRGDETLARLLGTRPDVRTAVARPVDGAALGRLRARGVDHVVIEGDALATSSRAQPTRPFLLQPAPTLIPGGTMTAVAGDAAIERLLEGEATAALRAQHVVAALSIVALEEPSSPRAVTIVNPAGFDPPDALLDALLTGLRGNPLLEPMTVDDVFTRIPLETTSGGTPIARELAPYTPPAPPVGALEYSSTQTRLDHFRGLAGATDTVVLRGERSLLVCEASTFDTPPGITRARATLKSIDVGIDAFVSRIRIPRPGVITLTSRSGEIPLTFRNDTGSTIDVYLELASAKLTFPDGATRTVRLPTKSTTVRVPVEARTSGTFPLQLSVTSADGSLPVANSTFRVRSTAFSTVGIMLMVGAVVFLVVWWGLHTRRSRRTRRVA